MQQVVAMGCAGFAPSEALAAELQEHVAASAAIGSARATAILFGQQRFPDTTAGARRLWFSLTPPLDAA